MKRIFRLFAILLAIVTLSCDSSNDSPANSETLFFELSKEFINVGAQGGEIEVIVFSNRDWEISGKYDWCRPKSYKGYANEDGVSVKFTIDSTDEDRKATFWFSAQDKQIEFTINQIYGSTIINMSDSTYNIPIEGGTIDIVYEANIECKVVIPEDATSWISVIDTRFLKENTISLSVCENGGSDYRVATVSIESIDDSSLSIDYKIVQEGLDPIFQINPTELRFSGNGGKASVNIKANVEWYIEEKSWNDWVDFTPANGDGDATVTFSVMSNDTEYERKAKITIVAVHPIHGPFDSRIIDIAQAKHINEDAFVIPADPQPDNFAFNHRAVVIDHTAVNCGYCPSMTDKLLALAETEWHKHYNEVTCHAGPFANGDPAASAAATALWQMYGVTGWPNIRINFYTAEVNNPDQSAFLAYMAQAFEDYIKRDGADVGIAMAVEGDEANIHCLTQIKAKETKEYKVVAWLLENNIYSPDQDGATEEYHKYYNFALRNISGEYDSSNVAGESVGIIEAGQTYDSEFTLPIVSTKWQWENMGVLVIVSAKDDYNRWEVVNSAYCPVQESKAFEYVE